MHIDLYRKVIVTLTQKELKEEIAKLKPPIRQLDLQSNYFKTPIIEGFFLDNNGDIWELTCSERGNKYPIAFFNTESDACEYLLSMYKKISDENRWF